MSTRASFLTTFPSPPERWEWLPGREDIRESSLLVQSGQEAGVEGVGYISSVSLGGRGKGGSRHPKACISHLRQGDQKCGSAPCPTWMGLGWTRNPYTVILACAGVSRDPH